MTSAFQPPVGLATGGLPESRDVPTTNRRILWVEIGIAGAAFLAFCVVVLLKATSLMEPDDYAYRGAIASLAQGHLELTTAQYKALSAQLGGIQQWTQLPNGRWISEKNPGYPFYAVWFWWAHALRFAPLVAGGLASTSLFIAARKWLGRWAGAIAVVFFLGSGLALAFAYRATMPTFTDASFLAAGAGALLWALLSPEVTWRRRTLVGVAGFLAMEWAVFMRYTDVVILFVAIAAVLCAWRPARLKGSTVTWWLGSVVAFGLVVMIFNWLVYGSPTKTGYASGEITFSFSSVIPNLKHMPELLVRSVPAMVVAGAAVIWMTVRVIRSKVSSSMPAERKGCARRDGLVGGFLALGWLGIWGLYLAYDWTAQRGGGGQVGMGGPTGGDAAIHLVRFYVPAIGLIALLATWFVMQLPRWLAPVLPVLAVVTAYGSFHTLTAGGDMAGRGGPPGGGGAGQFMPGGSGPHDGDGYGPPGMRNGTMPDGLPPGDGAGIGRPDGVHSMTPPPTGANAPSGGAVTPRTGGN